MDLLKPPYRLCHDKTSDTDKLILLRGWRHAPQSTPESSTLIDPITGDTVSVDEAHNRQGIRDKSDNINVNSLDMDAVSAATLERRGWLYAIIPEIHCDIRGMAHPQTGQFHIVPDAVRVQTEEDRAADAIVVAMPADAAYDEHARLRTAIVAISALLVRGGASVLAARVLAADTVESLYHPPEPDTSLPSPR